MTDDTPDAALAFNNEAREINTTNGPPVLVDACDYEMLNSMGRWFIKKSGKNTYAQRRFRTGFRANGKSQLQNINMQRFILLDAALIDHINGNGLDNRRCNLRSVSQAENQRNRAGANSNSKSGVLGVFWKAANQRWAAQARHDGKIIHIGLFDTIEEAAAARLVFVQSHWSAEDTFRQRMANRRDLHA